MSKGLEALEKLKNIDSNIDEITLGNEFSQLFTDIEEELKEKDELAQALSIATCENGELLKYKQALEIIKEDFFAFIDFKEEKRETKTYYLIDFNRGDYKVYLPKEKWDLLKEVLL